ncbi:MAG TPA: amidohydrolase family protein [Hyphomicrobiaceae bacterium]|nr:amidohydrolase family protein [Hyphomicrobiaceae bacterium]
MSKAQVIDIHAHVLTQAMIRSLRKEAPSINLKVTPLDRQDTVLEIAGLMQKPFPSKAWDLEQRFADMQAQGVDIQLVCNIPQTFLYDQDAALTAATAALLNEGIAALVRDHPSRLRGLATLPMQAPEAAAKELRRTMRDLGLKGAHIGSNVQGRNLDDAVFEPVWQTADELGAFMLVHPYNVVGRERMKSYYLQNLIGNPLETTIAVASLVFGGVIERYPRIRFCFAHGGGFAPYQAGRFRHGWKVRPEGKVHLKDGPAASLDRLLYDTVLHAREQLEFLIGAAGPSRVLLGTDYPFDMGQYDTVALVRSLNISAADKQLILGGAARALMGEA